MRYTLLILSLFVFSSAFSRQEQPESPRLVVGIKIDGLQTNHIRKMWKYFSAGGFRKIISEGVVLEQMLHDMIPAGGAADVATLMTGTYPCYHGISGDYYFNRTDNQLLAVLYDKNQLGIGTKDKFSARNLHASTLTDELMLANPFSQVHSVAIRAQEAILLGGHAATSVSWIDDTSNRWATTAYYPKGLSRYADMMNVDGHFNRLSGEKWTPSASIATFSCPTVAGSRTVPFNYNPTGKTAAGGVPLLKNTPAANALVTELAKTIFEKEQLGVDKHTDVLMLQYTVRIPDQIGDELRFAEQEDMYIRLDRALQSLLYTITSKIGADNLLLFVVGSGTGVRLPELSAKAQIPSGRFNSDRALALLNTYLMAIYGQEKWIEGYHAKQLFLNRKKIEEKQLNLHEFQNRVTAFLTEFEGIHAAYTQQEVFQAACESGDMRVRLRKSINSKVSGDIMIELMPGWVEVDNLGKVIGESSNPPSLVPIYFMGHGIKAGTVTDTHSMIDIAPTLTDMLGIPRPNACVGRRIVFEPK